MSEIKRGDLVMCVKPTGCCGGTELLGSVFTVIKIESGLGWCENCGKKFESKDAEVLPECFLPVSRLIRIDPPALDEETETQRELEKL